MPTHAPEPPKTAGREGLIPHFLWAFVKDPLSTTAAGVSVPAEGLLLHHLSYIKKKNQIHLLEPSSVKTTAITICFMATCTVMSTWTEQLLVVSKDTGCSCKLYHFGVPDSHFTERQHLPPPDSPSHPLQRRTWVGEEVSHPKTWNEQEGNVSYIEQIIYKQFN